MVKKIILTILLIAFACIMIWGGVNRTLARSMEQDTSGKGSHGQAGKNDGNDSHETGESREDYPYRQRHICAQANGGIAETIAGAT